MSNNLNQLERQILLGAVADLQRFLSMPPDPDCRDMVLHRAKLDALDGLVRCDATRWLAYPPESPSLRMAISRAYVGLEKRQLIDRVSCSWGERKTTHLYPTKAGIELAKQLTPATTATTEGVKP